MLDVLDRLIWVNDGSSQNTKISQHGNPYWHLQHYFYQFNPSKCNDRKKKIWKRNQIARDERKKKVEKTRLNLAIAQDKAKSKECERDSIGSILVLTFNVKEILFCHTCE